MFSQESRKNKSRNNFCSLHSKTQRGNERGEREREREREGEREWVKKLLGKFKNIPQTLDLLYPFYELKLHCPSQAKFSANIFVNAF